MTDIYLETLTYSKTEIDDQNSTESERVNEELDKKVDTLSVGSPSGIATLDGTGKHPPLEVPFATTTEVFEGTSTVTVVNPATFYYGIVTKTIPIEEKGTTNGVCPLGSDGKVNDSYLPAAQHVNTYVVVTLLERNALTGILVGDRAIVTADPSDTGGDVNGEYVADIADPTPTDWSFLPNLSVVDSVNGQTGTVDITSILESQTNYDAIVAWAANSQNNTDNITALDTRVGTNETDITAVTARVTTNENDIDLLQTADTNLAGRVTVNEGEITTNTSDIATNGTNIQANLDDIVLLDTRVAILEGDNPFTPFYQYDKQQDIVITDDAYEEIARLTTTEQPAGTYEYKLAMTYSLDSTSSSAYMRFSIDGGSTWNEMVREPKDNTDKIMLAYGFPYEMVAPEIIDIVVEIRKENAGDILQVYYIDIVAERKL